MECYSLRATEDQAHEFKPERIPKSSVRNLGEVSCFCIYLGVVSFGEVLG